LSGDDERNQRAEVPTGLIFYHIVRFFVSQKMKKRRKQETQDDVEKITKDPWGKKRKPKIMKGTKLKETNQRFVHIILGFLFSFVFYERKGFGGMVGDSINRGKRGITNPPNHFLPIKDPATAFEANIVAGKINSEGKMEKVPRNGSEKLREHISLTHLLNSLLPFLYLFLFLSFVTS
jgi:hypothetical protein